VGIPKTTDHISVSQTILNPTFFQPPKAQQESLYMLVEDFYTVKFGEKLNLKYVFHEK
jgi:hypothetical protein